MRVIASVPLYSALCSNHLHMTRNRSNSEMTTSFEDANPESSAIEIFLKSLERERERDRLQPPGYVPPHLSLEITFILREVNEEPNSVGMIQLR